MVATLEIGPPVGDGSGVVDDKIDGKEDDGRQNGHKDYFGRFLTKNFIKGQKTKRVNRSQITGNIPVGYQ